MAMTLKAAPQRLTPAYNPIKYIYDSTNKNLAGFKYIFEVLGWLRMFVGCSLNPLSA